MLRDITFDLEVELDQTVHSNGDTHGFYDHDLQATVNTYSTDRASAYPDMRKGRVQRLLAIHIKALRDDSDDGHQDAEKAVLENTGPDDLHDGISVADFAARLVVILH